MGMNLGEEELHVLLPVLHRGEGDLLEGGLHALSILSARSHVLDLRVLRQELLHRGLLHLSLLLPIHLVPHQDEGEFFGLLGRALVEELSDPALDVVEGLVHRQITRLLVISYTSTQQSAPL